MTITLKRRSNKTKKRSIRSIKTSKRRSIKRSKRSSSKRKNRKYHISIEDEDGVNMWNKDYFMYAAQAARFAENIVPRGSFRPYVF